VTRVAEVLRRQLLDHERRLVDARAVGLHRHGVEERPVHLALDPAVEVPGPAHVQLADQVAVELAGDREIRGPVQFTDCSSVSTLSVPFTTFRPSSL
jgi:hypothetical protein